MCDNNHLSNILNGRYNNKPKKIKVISKHY